MKEANRYSIIGILIAFIAVVFLSSTGFLKAALAGWNLNRLPRELRLGIEAGFIDYSECKSANLRKHISRGQFADMTITLLQNLGATENIDRKKISQIGIFNARPSYNSISRKQAIESMSRSCIFLANQNKINLPQDNATNYRDYRVPGKFSQPMSYMQKKYVIRGYPGNTMKAGRRLSIKEAVYFLYRLYEAVSSEMMAKKQAKEICFIDIPLNHPIMGKIRTLTKTGAFDLVSLRPAFDGNSNISIKELKEIISGIFNNFNHKVDKIRLTTIFADNERFVKRNELALSLEYLLSLADSSMTKPASRLSYLDVKTDSTEYEALTKLNRYGIQLGYNNGYFKGNQFVNWFETVSALAEVIEKIPGSHKVVTKTKNDRLAQQSDIKELIARIKAKKARIHKILNRPYKR
ncbi:MAG: S-layer homology domain-containing protein [Candidatus Rifleibacteriota bacterium]